MAREREPFQNRIINHLKTRFELLNFQLGNVALGTARGTDLEVLFSREGRDWVVRIEVEHQMRDIQYPAAEGWVRRHARPDTAATILVTTAAERTAAWFADPAKVQNLRRRHFPAVLEPRLQEALEDFALRRHVYFIPVDYYQELVVPLVVGIVFGHFPEHRPPLREMGGEAEEAS
jgi:hypothetical protein